MRDRKAARGEECQRAVSRRRRWKKRASRSLGPLSSRASSLVFREASTGRAAGAVGRPGEARIRRAARRAQPRRSYLELQEHGEDGVAQLGQERVLVRVPTLNHLLDAFLVHREGHLRVVQDLAHARDGHGDGRGGRREGAKGRAPRRGSSSGDVSEALRRVSPGDARRSERPGSRWAAVSRKNSSWHEDMSVGNQSEENRRLSSAIRPFSQMLDAPISESTETSLAAFSRRTSDEVMRGFAGMP